jgi:glycosyltransferase involved in cell wall biosynthesis
MSSNINHLYIVPSNDEHVMNWCEGFALAADNYDILVLDEVLTQSGLSGLNKLIELKVIETNISVIILDTSTPMIDPFFILFLKKKYNLMFLILNIDDEFKFDWITSTYSTIADLVLTFDHVSVERFRLSGINAKYFMHPVYISSIKFAANSSPKKYEVSFVGRVDSGKPSRLNLFAFLKEKEIDLSIFSSLGENDPAYLSIDGMYTVFNNSKINLSFSGITTYLKSTNILLPRIRGHKARPFEILAAGGFCLCEFAISTDKIFKDGKEIVFFYSKADLIEKINYYLANPNEATKIAKAGSKKVHQEFSREAVRSKFRKLIELNKKNIGIDLYGEPQKLIISKWFAYSHIEIAFPFIIANLLKGRIFLFLKDFSLILDFCKQLYLNIGIVETLKVVIISILRMTKTLLRKAKFW